MLMVGKEDEPFLSDAQLLFEHARGPLLHRRHLEENPVKEHLEVVLHPP